MKPDKECLQKSLESLKSAQNILTTLSIFANLMPTELQARLWLLKVADEHNREKDKAEVIVKIYAELDLAVVITNLMTAYDASVNSKQLSRLSVQQITTFHDLVSTGRGILKAEAHARALATASQSSSTLFESSEKSLGLPSAITFVRDPLNKQDIKNLQPLNIMLLGTSDDYAKVGFFRCIAKHESLLKAAGDYAKTAGMLIGVDYERLQFGGTDTSQMIGRVWCGPNREEQFMMSYYREAAIFLHFDKKSPKEQTLPLDLKKDAYETFGLSYEESKEGTKVFLISLNTTEQVKKELGVFKTPQEFFTSFVPKILSYIPGAVLEEQPKLG